MNQLTRRCTSGVWCITAVALLLVAVAPSPQVAGAQPDGDRRTRGGDPYPLLTCPVSGKKLGSMGEPVIHSYKGREVRFCCRGCIPRFVQNAAEYLAKLDAAIVKLQRPSYPTNQCIVMGDALECDDCKPIDLVHGNRLVRVCCKKCARKFKASPARYLAILNQVIIKSQRAKYPRDTCVVSGEKLGSMGNPFEVVLANRLVRLCCKGCVKRLRRESLKYLAELGKPVAPARRSDAPHQHGGKHDH